MICEEGFATYRDNLGADDSCWRAEEAFWLEMMGASGMTILIEALHSQLPHATQPRDLEKAHQLLKEKVKGSGLYQLQGIDQRLLVDEAVSCLASLLAGDAPKLKPSPAVELQRIYQSLPFFLQKKDADSNVVYGKEAWLQMMTQLSSITDAKDFEDYIVWSWLASPQDRVQVEAKRSELIKTAMQAEKQAATDKAQLKDDQQKAAAAQKQAEKEAKAAEKKAEATAARAKAAEEAKEEKIVKNALKASLQAGAK